MILTILKDNDTILREVSEPVSDFKSEGFKANVSNLIETLNSESSAVGLSAIQCGILQRIVITKINDVIKVMVNPEIIYEGLAKRICIESCLSLPQKIYEVERPIAVSVKYVNLEGALCAELFQDFEAQVFMHELQHTLGLTLEQTGKRVF